ncbi:MAG: OB-fold nucleic acid binding domain-containing protein, partial [Candidatus Binatia bacterium]
MDETTEQMAVRREKLQKVRDSGHPPYPNDFKPDHLTADIIAAHDALPEERLAALETEFSVAGRIMGVRSFGKASFLHIQDRKGRIQVYVRRDRVGD